MTEFCDFIKNNIKFNIEPKELETISLKDSYYFNHKTCSRCQTNCFNDDWRRFSFMRHECCCGHHVDKQKDDNIAENRCSFNRTSFKECLTLKEKDSNRNHNFENIMTNDIINGILENRKQVEPVQLSTFGKTIKPNTQENNHTITKPCTVEVEYDQIANIQSDIDVKNDENIQSSISKEKSNTQKPDETQDSLIIIKENNSINVLEKSPKEEKNETSANRFVKAFKALKIAFRRPKTENENSTEDLSNDVDNQSLKTFQINNKSNTIRKVKKEKQIKSLPASSPKNTTDTFAKCKLKSREKLLFSWDKVIKKASHDPTLLKEMLKKQSEKATDNYKKIKHNKNFKGKLEKVDIIKPKLTDEFIRPSSKTQLISTPLDNKNDVERPPVGIVTKVDSMRKSTASPYYLKCCLEVTPMEGSTGTSRRIILEEGIMDDNGKISLEDDNDIEKLLKDYKDDDQLEALKRKLSIYIKAKKTPSSSTNVSFSDKQKLNEDASKSQKNEIMHDKENPKTKKEPEIQMFYFNGDPNTYAHKNLFKTQKKLRNIYKKTTQQLSMSDKKANQPLVLVNFVTPFKLDNEDILHYCHHQNLFKTLFKPKKSFGNCDCREVSPSMASTQKQHVDILESPKRLERRTFSGLKVTGRRSSNDSSRKGSKRESLKSSHGSIIGTKSSTMNKKRRANKLQGGVAKDLSSRQLLKQISLFVNSDETQNSIE